MKAMVEFGSPTIPLVELRLPEDQKFLRLHPLRIVEGVAALDQLRRLSLIHI